MILTPYQIALLNEQLRARLGPLADELKTKTSDAWRDIKADPIGTAKQVGFGLAAGAAGTPMDLARMAYDGSPMGIANKVGAQLVGGVDPLPEKTPGGSDWLLEKFAPKPKNQGERTAQFLGTVAAPSPQGVARTVKGTASRIFGGMGAKNAPLKDLERAKDMENNGPRDPAGIWKETGWARSPKDDQWRFEIDDSAARYTHDQNKLSGKLETSLDHPELYKHYPTMRSIDTVSSTNSTDRRGSFSPGERRIEAFGEDADDGRRVLLHEAQHGVQAKEGFAFGDSPARIKAATGADDAYDRYRRSAGEVEARLVERRRDMTPEERRDVYRSISRPRGTRTSPRA